MDTVMKLISAVVMIFIIVIIYQVVGLGKNIEALRNMMRNSGSLNDVLRRHMLKNSDLKTAKPNLWIHLTVNKNLPFPGMSSLAGAPVNEPFSFKNVPALERVCANSVIQRNNKYFNIILVTDDDLPLLLPGWNVNLDAVPEAARCVVRQVAMLRLVYYYGGMVVPSTFAATQSFNSILSGRSASAIKNNKIVAFEAPHTGANVGPAIQRADLVPSSKFLFAHALNPSVRTIIDNLSVKTGTEAQVAAFKDLASETMISLAKEGKVETINGEIVGTRDVHGYSVTVEQAIDGFDRSPDSIGIWIPPRVFEVRKYGWLTYEEPMKILKGSTWLAAQLRV
jgi:hypothetical protein